MLQLCFVHVNHKLLNETQTILKASFSNQSSPWLQL